MRFEKFMREDTSDALNVDEPEVSKKYSDEYVAKRIAIIQDALKKVRGKSMDDEAKEAIMADLNDKLDKWENVEKETKAPELPAVGAAPEGEEDAPEGDAEEAPAEPDEDAAKKEEDKAKEDVEKAGDKEKDDEDKEKKKIKDDEDRAKRQEKAKTESVRLIKTKINRRA